MFRKNNTFERVCIDAFKDLKRKRYQKREDKIDNMIENLFCSTSVSEDMDTDQEFIVPIQEESVLRKRKGSTLIDILDRPTKIKRRRKNSLRKKSDLELIDDKTTIGTLSDFEFSRGSRLACKTLKSVTSHSFKSRVYSQKWTVKETKLFYRALGLFGTDFSMITLMFKGRSRSQIINKFHKEEKQNPRLIEKTLNKHKTCDNNFLKTYSQLFTIDGTPRSTKRDRVGSMDSTDQTIYEELSKYLNRNAKASSDSRNCPLSTTNSSSYLSSGLSLQLSSSSLSSSSPLRTSQL